MVGSERGLQRGRDGERGVRERCRGRMERESLNLDSDVIPARVPEHHMIKKKWGG